jgi:hypothetical protein
MARAERLAHGLIAQRAAKTTAGVTLGFAAHRRMLTAV